MRCSNMKIADILLFLINCMTISSLVTQKEKTSASTLNERLVNRFDEDCPFLMKIIQDNSVTDYTVNCKKLTTEKVKVNEEIALQYACSLVNNMIHFMCENKLNPSNENLNLDVSDPAPFCPFNLTSLSRLGVVNFIHKDIDKVLANEKLCSRVCYDLDVPKKQCVILSQLYNYLDSYQKQKVPVNVKQSKTELSFLSAPEVSGDVKQHEREYLSLPEQEVSMRSEHSEAAKLSPPQSKLPVTGQHNETEKSPHVQPKLSVKAELSEAEKPSSSQFRPSVNILDKTEKNNLTDKANQNKEHLGSLKEAKITSKINTETNGNKNSIHMPPENSKETEPKEKNASKPIANSTVRDEKKSTKVEAIKSSPSENDNGIDAVQDRVIDDDNQLLPLENQNGDLEMANDFEDSNKVLEVKFPQSDLQEGSYPERHQIYSGSGFFQAGESHFFFYFIMISSAVVIGYLAYHNKNKILAYALEGSNGRRCRRRPNPARYRKLETNLEEAISSNTPRAASSSVVY